MNWLKTLPITFQCNLEKVKVINFCVDREEVLPYLPEGVEPMDFGSKVMFSMADLRIRKMRPKHMPEALSFSYRHIALRLMVKPKANDGFEPKVYFFRCFADKAWVSCMGNLLTHYQLSTAEIDDSQGFHLKRGDQFISYELSDHLQKAEEPMFAYTKSLHAAYIRDGDQLKIFDISPQKWPLKPVRCTRFETNLFRSARFYSAYEATKSIPFLRFPTRPLTTSQDDSVPVTQSVPLLR